MLEPAFFDTNIFLYAFSEAPEDMEKREKARSILLSHFPCLSTQVMLEFTAVALRRPALGITEPLIDSFLAGCASFHVEILTPKTILHATEIRRRHSVSHWDGTILAAAAASDCRTLFSEDLQDGFSLGPLVVSNPFKVAGQAPSPPSANA